MGTSSKQLAKKLRETAAKQHGCFTAAQAVDAGYADSVHLYHVKNNDWVRIFRGVYRFSDIPETPAARCMAVLLWSRDRSGRMMGILSTETAAQLQAGTLTPGTPIKIYVPKGFRRNAIIPKGIKIEFLKKTNPKTSKIQHMPVLADEKISVAAGKAVAGSGTRPHPSAVDIPKEMDAADYYDLLDYEAAKQR